ncbi:hypothetical protein LTR53_012179 [Teratosphaeriaceae sp. CCFEE 6253]|nr:hypothetical protein LTR53_012179 [Teratosphaeriaceae sp. CCFEE 6253]
MDEEDFFSDDDLDGIPDDTFRELEQNALASTQLASGRNHAPVKSAPLWRAPQPQYRPQPAPPSRSAPPASAPAPPSSDYGFDEEDVIDLDAPSMVIQPASGPRTAQRQQLAAAPTVPFRTRPPLDSQTEAAFAAADAELGAPGPAQWSHAPHLQPRSGLDLDLSALQARVAELEASEAHLREAEQTARNAAAIKAGEIAIVRSNQEKTAREYERRIAVMTKMHADESGKMKGELEVGRKERERLGMEKRFLVHDLEQETERSRRVGAGGKPRGMDDRAGTPQKAKKAGRGDGFEDADLSFGAVSPSKSREKTKDGTPKHGAKRRRTAHDSPVAALSFTQPPEPVRQESNDQLISAPPSQSRAQAPSPDARYAFLQRLLSHRAYGTHERSIELLSKHSLPSQTSSLSSMLLDQLSQPSNDDNNLTLKLSRALLHLWSQCLSSSHYTPLYLLLDLLSFALYNRLASLKAQLIEEALPLCIQTIDLVASQAIKIATHAAFAAVLDRAAHERLRDELCADDVLDLLSQLCDAATLVEGRLEAFWGRMQLLFVLIMLNKSQPVNQIISMLKILSTSALADSFGPIQSAVDQNDDGDDGGQHKQDTGIIDRLTCLLFETPDPPPEGEEPYTEAEVAELRLAILDVLRAMCATDHGGLLLARHRSAIGRLIRFLDAQINKLYTLPPPLRPASDTAGKPASDSLSWRTDAAILPRTAHELVARSINLTLRIFHHLLHLPDHAVDLTAKLNVIRGGHQKFLVAMTRVAFAEQVLLEEGIEEEVVEAAHSVLDDYLSPEEGEAIVAAVETPGGSKGSWSLFTEAEGMAEKGGEGAGKDGEAGGDALMDDPD